jgi:hypothetical protein
VAFLENCDLTTMLCHEVRANIEDFIVGVIGIKKSEESLLFIFSIELNGCSVLFKLYLCLSQSRSQLLAAAELLQDLSYLFIA